MDYKTNAKYFEKSKLFIFILAALGAVVIGLLLMFLLDSQPAFLIAAIVAVVIFVVGYSREVKDADIDDCAIPIMREFRETFHARFLEKPIDKLKMMSSEYRNRKEPEYWGVFYMEDDDVAGKHGRDGTFRSSAYCACGIWFEKERVSVGTRVVSLIDEKMYEDFREFDFTEMEHVEYVPPKYPDMARYRLAAFKKIGSDDVMYVPVQDDAHTEEMIETINVTIDRLNGVEGR